MLKIGQMHRVRTGFSFCKVLKESGEIKWALYTPKGEYIKVCDNYFEAYELATNLKEV